MLSVNCNTPLEEQGDSAPAPVGICARHTQPSASVYAFFEIGHSNNLAFVPSKKEASFVDGRFQN
jgi:hypothetical protein